ncbi:MAG: protoporphyrinogen oxidase, partial [Anaerolineales bacterium]
MTKRVVIIGGGIAGLSAAHFLQKHSREAENPLHLTILEASSQWGGKITTERVDGFVVEGGPDTFLRTKPWAVALCRELGLEDRLHGTNPEQKKTYVLRHGSLHPLPDGLTMMIPTQFSPMVRTGLLSWPEKVRMGLDFFIPPQPLNGDESLGEFVSRRLGRAAYENLIEPLMSGIYAGDGDQLSLQATFPYLRDLENKHGGLVRGALAARGL